MIRDVTKRRIEWWAAVLVGLVLVIGVGRSLLRPRRVLCDRDAILEPILYSLEDLTRMPSALRAPQPHTHPQLQAHLELLRASKVQLKLTNTSATQAYVDRTNLPQDGKLENDVFKVGNGEDEAEYLGQLYKRAPPDEDDFDVIGPGESKSYVIDLFSYYELKLRPRHRIWYEAYHGRPNDPKVLYRIVSNEVVAW